MITLIKRKQHEDKAMKIKTKTNQFLTIQKAVSIQKIQRVFDLATYLLHFLALRRTTE